MESTVIFRAEGQARRRKAQLFSGRRGRLATVLRKQAEPRLRRDLPVTVLFCYRFVLLWMFLRSQAGAEKPVVNGALRFHRE